MQTERQQQTLIPKPVTLTPPTVAKESLQNKRVIASKQNPQEDLRKDHVPSIVVCLGEPEPSPPCDRQASVA